MLFNKSYVVCLLSLLLSVAVHAEKLPLFKGSKIDGNFSHLAGAKILVDGYEPVSKSLWLDHIAPFLATKGSSKANNLAPLLLSSQLSPSMASNGFTVSHKCQTSRCLSFVFDISPERSEGQLIVYLDKLLNTQTGQLKVHVADRDIDILDVTTQARGLIGETIIKLPIVLAEKLKHGKQLLVIHSRGKEKFIFTPQDLKTINKAIEIYNIIK